MNEADLALELTTAEPLANIYGRYLREPRFYLLLLSALSALALVVATIGVYGVVAYAVTRRTGEIGIRMVLGARWLQIVSLLFRQTIVVAAVGIGVGLAGAASLTRYIKVLLFGIEPTGPGRVRIGGSGADGRRHRRHAGADAPCAARRSGGDAPVGVSASRRSGGLIHVRAASIGADRYR